LCVTNIIGPNGIKLQNKAITNAGKLNVDVNNLIEGFFDDWGKSCTIEGGVTLLDVERIIITSTAIDGEIFVRLYDDPNNKYYLSMQLLESDYLDVNFNNENARIRMGIEYDELGRRVAYWFYKNHPGDNKRYTRSIGERVRVPAADVIHVFYQERPSQTRGVPWMHSAMTRLNHLGAYEEAELVASRVASAKMGFIVNPGGDDYKGPNDTDGNIQIEAEPGTWEQLPTGYDIRQWDPQHPGGNFEQFMKVSLRGIAAGLNVSYAALTSDLRDVNYSSSRFGSLDERDHWRVKQRWIASGFFKKLYERILTNVLTLGLSSRLFPSKYEQYNKPEWYARSWDWVDPRVDAAAAILEIDNGLNTKSDILAAQGKDFYDLLETMKQENAAMKESGIELKPKEKPETKPEQKPDNNEVQDGAGNTV
jgi:lambda family phage portal protein